MLVHREICMLVNEKLWTHSWDGFWYLTGQLFASRSIKSKEMALETVLVDEYAISGNRLLYKLLSASPNIPLWQWPGAGAVCVKIFQNQKYDLGPPPPTLQNYKPLSSNKSNKALTYYRHNESSATGCTSQALLMGQQQPRSRRIIRSSKARQLNVNPCSFGCRLPSAWNLI